ncbi:serine hydrolase [Maribacter arcticus]|uniref:Beta-lactamase enzyme family protein n=1 Tax=Maribacter arcticus TaxID=561365 RepID=A0A1T4ZYW3_9FLAO|nr:serine hydrolase [Maribacter arcticus]SKB27991.1 Beta-lactamase enzyme family protein [Maribacter arcticus]|tara:strand:+ start:1092 stop:2219 length:1128 start_codon:yes stop_codon:yes gene_type:complete
MKQLLLLISCIFLISCSSKEQNLNFLETALSSKNPKIKRVMDSIENYQVQIRYTQIDRRNDSVIFTDYDFQVNDSNYFYPASTVKFPTAVLALERLNTTDTLTMNTRYYVEGDTIESTFKQDVSEIFAVSDNLANNRLVELLGFEEINNSLRKKGITPVRIAHRLGQHSDDLRTKPLIVYLNDSSTGITKSILNKTPLELNLLNITKGSGYYQDDILIIEPFDFSSKNYFPISSQHNLIKRVIFPQNFDISERFNLSVEQRKYLLSTMHTVPRKAGYDQNSYYDGYCKFFIYGDTKENIPEHLEIYNKVGFAYGTLTDCAYIKDTEKNIDFLLTATILVNKDGIFNDDAYEYDEIGIPFLAQLGREIYQQELKRK